MTYGMELWFIHQERNGTKYYYKGTENRGRRVWTERKKDAYFFCDKTEAVKMWEDLGRIGAITGGYF